MRAMCSVRRPWAILALVWLTSCDNTQQSASLSRAYVTEVYLLNVMHVGWDVTLCVNDQPAFRGGDVSCAWDVTPFVVAGENTAELVAVPPGGASHVGPRPVQLLHQFADGAGKIQSEVLGVIDASESTGVEVQRKRIAFSARAPAHWVWQDSMTVGELTQADRDEIEIQVQRLAQLYRSGDVRALVESRLPWAVNTEPAVRVLGLTGAFVEADFKRQMAQLSSVPGYEVSVSSPDTWRFWPGTKVVHVSVAQPPPPELGMSTSASIEEQRRARNYILYAGYARGSTPPTDDQVPWRMMSSVYAVRTPDGWKLLRDQWVRGEF